MQVSVKGIPLLIIHYQNEECSAFHTICLPEKKKKLVSIIYGNNKLSFLFFLVPKILLASTKYQLLNLARVYH